MPIFRGRPELLTRFRAGDKAALGEVYDAYAEKVGRLLRRGFQLRGDGGVRLGPQDLLDVAQEVFVKAFSPSARQGYDGLRDYEPYLLMIARNASVDWLRRHGGAVTLAPNAFDEMPGDTEAPGERAPWENPDTLALLERYLAGLPSELAALHRHRYVDGLSQEASARAMGISRQNLRTLEDKLRRGLGEALGLERARLEQPTTAGVA
jgi:RNA polymerase sigma factor (sigma-70 family)